MSHLLARFTVLALLGFFAGVAQAQTLAYGDYIALRSDHGSLLTALNNSLYQSTDSVEKEQLFILIGPGLEESGQLHFGESTCLRTVDHKYVSARDSGVATTEVIGCQEWERFRLVNPLNPLDQGPVSVGQSIGFLSHHLTYLSARNNGTVRSDAPALLDWEIYTVETDSSLLYLGDSLGFFTHHQTWLTAFDQGALDSNRQVLAETERFSIYNESGWGFRRPVSFGDKVTLRSDFGFFVTVENDGEANANRSQVDFSEIWKIVDPRDPGSKRLVRESDPIAFRNFYHQTFLNAQADGSARADAQILDIWETFVVTRNATDREPLRYGDRIALFNTFRSVYVIADGAHAGHRLRAEPTVADDWERFSLAGGQLRKPIRDGDQVALLTHHGFYVERRSPTSELYGDATEIASNSRFVVRIRGREGLGETVRFGDEIALVADDGTYVYAAYDDNTYAASSGLGDLSAFRFDRQIKGPGKTIFPSYWLDVEISLQNALHAHQRLHVGHNGNGELYAEWGDDGTNGDSAYRFRLETTETPGVYFLRNQLHTQQRLRVAPDGSGQVRADWGEGDEYRWSFTEQDGFWLLRNELYPDQSLQVSDDGSGSVFAANAGSEAALWRLFVFPYDGAPNRTMFRLSEGYLSHDLRLQNQRFTDQFLQVDPAGGNRPYASWGAVDDLAYRWRFEPSGDDGYYYLRNRLYPDKRLHVGHNGDRTVWVELGGDDAYLWKLERVGGQTVYLRNKMHSDQRLHVGHDGNQELYAEWGEDNAYQWRLDLMPDVNINELSVHGSVGPR